MSATHSRFGAVGRNWRSTRSVAGVTPGIRIVVFQRFRGLTPEIPAAFINRATRLRETRIPRSKRSSAWIRGEPYVPRLAAWICLIFSVSQASSSARSDGARRSQLWKPVRFTPNTRHITATG
jgi:hypothetical protein